MPPDQVRKEAEVQEIIQASLGHKISKIFRKGCEKLSRILPNIREKKQGNTFGMLWDSIESLETHLSNEKRKKTRCLGYII